MRWVGKATDVVNQDRWPQALEKAQVRPVPFAMAITQILRPARRTSPDRTRTSRLSLVTIAIGAVVV